MRKLASQKQTYARKFIYRQYNETNLRRWHRVTIDGKRGLVTGIDGTSVDVRRPYVALVVVLWCPSSSACVTALRREPVNVHV